MKNKLKTKLKFYEGKFTEPSMSTCLITISVGQANHESAKFASTLYTIDKKFREGHIIICDSLQRFNYRLYDDLTALEAYEKSIIMGKQWIDRNKIYIKPTNIPIIISHWDQWLQHEKFKSYHSFMKEQYNSNEKFKFIMEETINNFYLRNKTNYPNISFEKIFINSLHYLLEECAVQSVLANYDFNYEIYPNKRNAILTYCHKTFISNIRRHVLIPVALKYESKELAILS